MPNRLLLWSLVLLTGGFLRLGIGAEPLAPKILFDFESAEELAKWNGNGVTATLSAEHATHGKHSALLVFKPGQGFQTFMVELGKNKIDLAGYTHLCIDVFAPVNTTVAVKLKSSDGKKKWEQEFALEPDASSILIPLEDTALDLAKIDQISLFMSDLGAETVLYIAHIRAENLKAGDLPKRAPKLEVQDEEKF